MSNDVSPSFIDHIFDSCYQLLGSKRNSRMQHSKWPKGFNLC